MPAINVPTKRYKSYVTAKAKLDVALQLYGEFHGYYGVIAHDDNTFSPFVNPSERDRAVIFFAHNGVIVVRG